MNDIKQLLEVLKRINEAETIPTLAQEIFPPENLALDTVPTLLPGVEKPMSEMLRARYEFAGAWVNAAFKQTWLGLSQMRDLKDNGQVLENLEIDRRHYEHHILQGADWGDLSLFGIDLQDGGKTFLEWRGTAEPRVITYVGYSIFRYRDLRAALVPLIKSETSG
jgi:hypothetical protein